MGKRQEAAQETRRNIVEAVKLLLEEKSADAINIEEITTKAGVAKGSFYTYFKRKEDVISEVALEEYAILKELLLNSSDGVYGQLCVYLKRSVEIIEKNTLQIAQQWMKSVVAPLEEEKSGITKYRYDHDNIVGILESAVQRGELRGDAPVKAMGAAIMNFYYGAVANWCITKGGEGGLAASMEAFCADTLKTMLDKYKQY